MIAVTKSDTTTMVTRRRKEFSSAIVSGIRAGVLVLHAKAGLISPGFLPPLQQLLSFLSSAMEREERTDPRL